MTSKAVVESLATICVGQARSGPDAEASLKEFGELKSWKQLEFVEAAHWATMPGGESSLSGVAELCTTKLRQT